ncbi:phosphotransferase [Cupriavidus necator]|uniref:phosphotransferase n=1 Tax=Cupriavidus necator TaxID=106590 RepID=UPI001892AE1C|nr:phosphotransferase [Cupriavidus necator]
MDYRFDPDLAKHEEKLKVRQRLAHKFAVEHAKNDVEEISLYPVARAGKSGSEVFYLDLSLKTFSFPERFVAKFQSCNQTDNESSSARSAQVAKFCNKIFSHKDAEADVGIIVYDLAAAHDHIEFRGFFLDLQQSNNDCAIALKSIFQLVGRHPNSAQKPKKFFEDFEWYVNRKSKPSHRIDALTLVAPVHHGIGAIAKTIQEYFHRIEREFNLEVHPYLVHGDLHARNLMLSKSNPAKTELIDFGWVHSGHPAKDFVLMENTLKYMLMPELLPLARGDTNDPLYIPAKSIEAFERYLCEHGFDLPTLEDMQAKVFEESDLASHHKHALSRVYCCLIEVRRAAGEVLRHYCTQHNQVGITPEHHYFASLFLVTFGLLGMPEQDQIWTLIGLHTVGNRIWGA